MTLFKKSKMQDILEQKESKLVSLSQQSDNVVQLVLSTLDILDAINTEIDQTVFEIDEMQARMNGARVGLEARRTKNQRIKQKFQEFTA